MTLVIQFVLLACRTMREGNMIVPNVVEEVYFLFLQHQTRSNGVNRCVTPSLVEEATVPIQRSKEVNIGLRP